MAQGYPHAGDTPLAAHFRQMTEDRASRKEFAAGVRSAAGGLSLLETVLLARVVKTAIRRRR